MTPLPVTETETDSSIDSCKCRTDEVESVDGPKDLLLIRSGNSVVQGSLNQNGFSNPPSSENHASICRLGEENQIAGFLLFHVITFYSSERVCEESSEIFC